MPDRGHLSLAGALRAIVAAPLGLVAVYAAAAETPIPSAIPLRAPLLAAMCAAPEDAELAGRRTGYCAGYLRAVLENDPRLGDCRPMMPDVMDEVIARQRRARLTDDDVLARDFVVDVARDLCRRRRG